MNSPIPLLGALARTFRHHAGASRTLLIALLTASALPIAAASPTLRSDHDAYFPGEEIRFSFAGGPGNRKDWIGVYPIDVEPGTLGSTIWRYVDGTQSGTQGFVEGSIAFPAGLNLAGDWNAYFLLNDGYTKLATNLFRVIDPGTPAVRVSKRTYTTGEAIQITFTNGPANNKDWVGIYKVDQTPGGGVNSTLWNYVDGTRTGSAGLDNGTLQFPTGLTQAGEWVAHFLANDGYEILASETFTVTAPAPVIPRVVTLSPSAGDNNLSPALEFAATIANGSSKLVPASVQLLLNGTPVTAQVTPDGDQVRIAYTASTLAPAGSTHTWVLTFQDDATPPNTVRAETSGTVRAYRNIVLANPVYFENFDAIPEGSLPDGWTELAYSSPIIESIDFGDLGSAAYRTWTVVNVDRFTGSFVTYGNPDNPDGWETDYQRVLSPNPANVVNGAVLNGPLAQGRMLFGNSGYQNGGASQVLFLQTRDFDLTGKTNIHLGFNSLWEQNQDSIAAIEFSTNQGQSWHPIAYFIDRLDIVSVTNETSGAVTVDVDATLNTERGDVARYIDDQGNELGGTYGAFIAAPISQDLAPYLQGRIDDNPVESKRVEWFRLPEADNQAKVRFRFAHAGTDSWYFGIDDFGIYAPTDDTGPAPSLAMSRSDNDLVLSWPAGATGYVLESATSVAGGWQAVTGVSGNSHRVTPLGTGTFYRLRKP